MRFIKVVVCFVALGACLAGCGAKGMTTHPYVPPTSRFEIETITAGNVRGPSLSLDAAGQPHIAYLDYDNQLTKYAVKDTAGWHLDTVDLLSRIYPSVNGASVTYARGGLWFVLYAGETPETVDLYSVVSSAVTERDLSGEPWIAYLSDNYYLTMARRTVTGSDYHNGVWTTYPSIADDVSYMDFVLDTQEHPHVAYCNGGDLINGAKRRDLFYQGLVGGGRVDTATVGQVSIAVDAQGQPRICYLRQDGDLLLAAENAGNWTISTIATGVVPAGNPNSEESNPSLQVDASGNLHVIYRQCVAPMSLNYATRDVAGVWKIEPVETGPAVGSGALVLDGQGAPHIVFWDGGGVKYATLPQ